MFIIDIMMEISNWLWGWPLLILTSAVAVYLSVRFKFFQFTRFGHAMYGDNVFEKDGIRRDRTGDGEKTRCLCGKRGIFNRDGPAMGPQIIRQLE